MSERGVFPLTEKDLDRIGVCTRMTGETCDSPGYKNKATRLPLGALTIEEQSALVAAYPNFKIIPEIFEEMNKRG